MTLSDLAVLNDDSHSISNLSYSNDDTINLLKKCKKQKNHHCRLIFNKLSVFMKQTATFINVKVNDINSDMLSCDNINKIENAEHSLFKR